MKPVDFEDTIYRANDELWEWPEVSLYLDTAPEPLTDGNGVQSVPAWRLSLAVGDALYKKAGLEPDDDNIPIISTRNPDV